MSVAEVLDQLDAVRAKATPGPWRVGRSDATGSALLDEDGDFCGSAGLRADAALIVAAVNALPKLTAAVRAVEAVLDALDQTIAEAEAEGQRAVIDARVVSARTRAVLADALAGTQ